MIHLPTKSTHFPYTTLFRSFHTERAAGLNHDVADLSVSMEISARLHIHAHRRSEPVQDRKSTRLNSSHVEISYAVICLKKKNKTIHLQMKKQHIGNPV